MRHLECVVEGTSYDVVMDYDLNYQVGNNCSSTINILVPVVNGVANIPKAGSIVKLQDVWVQPARTTRRSIYIGVCGIPTTPTFSTGNEPIIVRLICKDITSILARRLVSNAWLNATVGDIVNGLASIIKEEGFLIPAASTITSPSFSTYVCNFTNLQTVLDELAQYANAVWWLTPSEPGYQVLRGENTGLFHFALISDLEAQDPMLTFDENSTVYANSLQHIGRDYKMRTVQYVTGALSKVSGFQSRETIAYTGDSFTLQYAIRQLTGSTMWPAIWVYNAAGTQVTTPASIYQVGSGIGFNGIDDNTSGVYFLITYGSNTINLSTNASAIGFEEGWTIQVTYAGSFSMPLVVTNDAAIAEIHAATGTSGKIENLQELSSNYTDSEALTVAQNYINYYNAETGEVDLVMTGEQLYNMLPIIMGQVAYPTYMIHAVFNLPSLGITGDYYLTEWNISPLYLNVDLNTGGTGYLDGVKAFYKQSLWKLKFLNRDYLRSYGETISGLKQQINALSVRSDELANVVNRQAETAAMSGATNIGTDTMVSYPSDSGLVPVSMTNNADGTVYCQTIEGVTYAG